MYQVYSQQRAGHPRWTLGASAALLLLTVLLAAAVTRYKAHVLQVPLDKERVFARGQLRCALPSGWKLEAQDNLPRGIGIVLDAQELEEGEPGSRRLLIFRDLPHP